MNCKNRQGADSATWGRWQERLRVAGRRRKTACTVSQVWVYAWGMAVLWAALVGLMLAILGVILFGEDY